MNIFKITLLLMMGCFSIINSLHAKTAPKDYSTFISVVDPSFKYTHLDNNRRISSLGFLLNSSDVSVTSIVLEVQYYDANNKMVDSATQQLYSMLIPAGDSVSFAIKDEASTEKGDYVSHKIRVLSARSSLDRIWAPKKEKSVLIKLLVSLAPIVLLILVWVVIARRYNGKTSHLAQTVELMTKQNELFERLVAAVENKNKEN